MPQTRVFRLPQRQMKWGLAFFISQLVMINFAFAGNPNFLGTLVFRLFWLLPITGTIFYLRRARSFELRICSEAIVFETNSDTISFPTHDPGLQVSWTPQPNRIMLKLGQQESLISFAEYHKDDREPIRDLVREAVPQSVQNGWPEYEIAEAASCQRSRQAMQKLSRFAFPAMFALGAVIAILAVLVNQLHLILLAVVNVVVGLHSSSSARRWLTENPDLPQSQ